MVTDPVIFHAKLYEWQPNPLRFQQSPVVDDGLGIWRAEDSVAKYVVVKLFNEYAAYVLPSAKDVHPQALANSKRISTIGLPLFLSLEDAVIACEQWRDKQEA